MDSQLDFLKIDDKNAADKAPDEFSMLEANEKTGVTARCVIPCNHKIKMGWDIFIMVLLLVTTAIIPVRLAFVEEDSP